MTSDRVRIGFMVVVAAAATAGACGQGIVPHAPSYDPDATRTWRAGFDLTGLTPSFGTAAHQAATAKADGGRLPGAPLAVCWSGGSGAAGAVTGGARDGHPPDSRLRDGSDVDLGGAPRGGLIDQASSAPSTSARRESWVSDQASTIVVNTANYDAYCDKSTGLCDFYSKSGVELFHQAGDTCVEEWDGVTEFTELQDSGFHTDDLWIIRSQSAVPTYTLSENGASATLTFTHTLADEIRFDTTYTFSQQAPTATVSTGITYLTQKKVYHELIKTGLVDGHTAYPVDAFEPAVLSSNGVQADSLDTLTDSWHIAGQAALEANTNGAYVREGGGSLKVTFMDDGDGSADLQTGVYSAFAPTDYPGATHLSFWVYPLQRMRFRVTLSNASGSKTTDSTYFAPNRWSRFQWDFARSAGFSPTGVNQLAVYCPDNGYGFVPPFATAYLDDIRFSQDIQNGLMTATYTGSGCDFWNVDGGTLSLDDSFHDSGEGALRWEGVNLSSAAKTLSQWTTKTSPAANPSLPIDISSYDCLTLDVYTDSAVSLPLALYLYAGPTARYSTPFYVPPNRWTTITWYFNNPTYYYEAFGPLDLSAIRTYMVRFFPTAGAQTSTLWLDDLRFVRYDSGQVIFNSEAYQYKPFGRAVSYSPRLFKTGATTYIYGDSFGAGSIERMERAAGELHAYIYDGDMHTFKCNVNRSGIEAGTTYYKELTRAADETVQATLVFAFYDTAPQEIVKARWPRAFDAAYTISEDDLYFAVSKAYYCGTSNSAATDYGQHGVVGHNLRSTKNLWYYLTPGDGGGTSLDNAEVRAFIDLLSQKGIEIAVHSPGSTADDRTQAVTALDGLVNTYGTRAWVDHASSANPEDFVRRGRFPFVNGQSNTTGAGYYMFDLLKQRAFKYVWPVTNPFSGAGSVNPANLFAERYKDTCPLPYTSRSFDDAPADEAIVLFGRGWGNGRTEFLQRGGGGDIQELNEVMDAHGLVLVYTHSHEGYSQNVGGYSVLAADVEAVFGELENMQNAGRLWVETTSGVLDWMLANEKVVVETTAGAGVVVTNHNAQEMRGVTLQLLNDSIRSATIDGRYQIYVDGNEVVLPPLEAGQSKTIEITGGPLDIGIPRLVAVDAHVDVAAAEYDPATKRVVVQVRSATSYDVDNKSITLAYNASPVFALLDNDYPFASIVRGSVIHVEPNYGVSALRSADGELRITLPHLSSWQTIEAEARQPQADMDGSGNVDLTDFGILAACLAGPQVDTPPEGCTAVQFDQSDLDDDGDVDLLDVAEFELYFGLETSGG
jgi:hypothetical protein